MAKEPFSQQSAMLVSTGIRKSEVEGVRANAVIGKWCLYPF
jgi:hypothetical protein